MTRQKLLIIVALALVVFTLGACDSGVPASVSTPTTQPAAVTAEPGVPESEPTSTTEASSPEDSPTDLPTVEGDPTSPPPTEVSEATTPPATIAIDGPLPPLPDGPLTLVALGDSLTEGDGDYETEGGGFPVRLERSLVQARADSQVINLGASGWTSQQMVEGQLPSALDYKPNIATVWIGSNNLWYNSGPEGEAQDIESYTKDIDTTLRALKGAGAHTFVALLDDQTLRPYATANNYANFTPEQLAHMSQLTLKFNDVLRAKAAEYDATIVDFFNTTIFTDPATLAEDGIHPNSAGYDIIARMWFDTIKAIL